MTDFQQVEHFPTEVFLCSGRIPIPAPAHRHKSRRIRRNGTREHPASFAASARLFRRAGLPPPSFEPGIVRSFLRKIGNSNDCRFWSLPHEALFDRHFDMVQRKKKRKNRVLLQNTALQPAYVHNPAERYTKKCSAFRWAIKEPHSPP